MRIVLLVWIAVLLVCCQNKQGQEVDTIVRNGVVYTVDAQFTTEEALAIKDGKVVAVGTDADITANYKARQMVDAHGQAVYPGFIDAHAHFVEYGKSLFSVNLYGAQSWDEVIDRVQKFAAKHPADKWITGSGWDQNKWAGKAFPSREKLDVLFPQTPVLLSRVDGHAAIANGQALALAGVIANQKIIGGTIETRNGKTTGMLVDNAVELVASKMPPVSAEVFTRWLTAAEENCFATGLTTIADCGLMYNAVEGIDQLQKAGKLNMRLYVMLSDDTANFNRYLHKAPYKTDKLYVKGIKVYADGALGSRGACLLQPYNDKKGWYGFLLRDKNHYDSLAQVIAKTDFQMCTHAIGDSANRLILTIYNKVLNGDNDRRWRIEHAQVIDPDDFDLFGKSDIVPSVQPTHATSDMYWAEERLGDVRITTAYAYKQLLRQNGWLPLGTDFPVEDISPFKTFLAAVFRTDARGYPAGGFQPENALTREQAIRGMTIWAAKACFLEKEVGSLEVGKKADFIIVNQDLMKVSGSEVLNTKVVSTWLGGKRVTDNNGDAWLVSSQYELRCYIFFHCSCRLTSL